MNVNQWCAKDERIAVNIRKEYWKMETGQKFSEERIAQLEKDGAYHARTFLKNFKQPRELYEGAVGALLSEQTYPLHLALNKARKEKIASHRHKYRGKPVTWQTWRQFVVKATDTQRKDVFDEFIHKAHLLDQIIQKHFELAADILGHYGLDPLKDYLKDHHVGLNKLRSVIHELNDGTKHAFQKQWKHFSEHFLNREPRYYDDFYFIRNLVYEDLVPAFKNVKPYPMLFRTMQALGFSNKHITVDDADRPGKYASPFCSAVKIPTDVRVSFKAENPLQTTESLYHEFGHAIHESSIDAKLPYWVKYQTSEGLAETFSTMFEYLLQDELYLTEHVGLPMRVAKTLVERAKFTELYAINFYSANSLFKIDYWNKRVAFEDCNALYAKRIKQCMNINLPGAYWKLHHILPENLMYVPSYLLAMTNSFNVIQELKNDFGERWWNERKAGGRIKNFMKPGSKSPLGKFSKLDTREFVKHFTRQE
jgi:hypothetical protein